MNSFRKLNANTECIYLVENHTNAFVLSTLIALRARRDNSYASMGLSKGQAFIGDYRKCGLTRQKYRDAMAELENFGLASFWTTRKGTIATILDTRIYDINPEHENPEGTTEEPEKNLKRTTEEPVENPKKTTNKKIRNKEIINNNTGEVFEKFWEIYPRKIGKETAKKAFEKLNPDETLANSIIGSLKAQLKAGLFNLPENMKYCLYASTWLNQGRYNDISEDIFQKAEEQTIVIKKTEPDYEEIRKKILEHAPELNKMFRKKVIEPLEEELSQRSWDVWIKPFVIKSADKKENTAFIYHGMGNSWVKEHYKGRIEEKLGMGVEFVAEDG